MADAAAASRAEGPRVLSLLSAATEIVHRLGCAHLLVGRSHGCNDPPLALVLPIATAPRVDPNASSAAIDAAVRAQSTAGGAIYEVREATVRGLRPDVIITQEQCRICAVTPDDVAAACAGAAKMVVIKPVRLGDVYGDVLTISAALGVPKRGARLVGLLKQRMATVASQCSSIVAKLNSGPPKVAHVEWLAPLMGSGYWIAECVAAAGCTMVHGDVGGHSQTLPSLAALSEAEVIILAPCGFSIERTRAELAALGLLERPAWLALKAVRAGRVFVADGDKYFNRSSCCVVETAEMVAEMVWPSLVGLWGHHGNTWVGAEQLAAFCSRQGAPPTHKPVDVARPVGTNAAGAAQPSGGPAPKRAKLAGGAGGVSEPELEPEPAATPVAHVERQIAHLRAGQFARAFGMNSAANRARLGDAAQFEAVVRTNSSFGALAEKANPCACTSSSAQRDAGSGEWTVEARVQAAQEGALTFAFAVSAGAGGAFETDGVRVVC